MKTLLRDEWGHDPSVQSLRRVFSYMEKAQSEWLSHLNISFYDQGLRNVRKQALELFERAWPQAVRQGVIGNEKEAASLYLHCLTRASSSIGIKVPDIPLPENEKIIRFLKEKLP